jgi:hypothetical protein
MTTSPTHESTVEVAQLLLLEQSSSEVISPEVQEQSALQPDVARVEPPVIVWRRFMLEP